MSMAFTQNSFCTIQNYGTISGGFTQTGGSITNYSGGKFTPSSYTATGGSLVNNSGGTVTFPSSVVFPSGYSLTNNGTITIPGFRVVSGATVALTGTSQTISGNVVNDGTFSYTGTGSIGGTMSEGASAITNFTGTVTITSSFKDSGTVNLNGSLTVDGLYTDIAGTQVNETGTGCNALTLTGGYLSNLGTFNGNNTAFQVTPAPFCTTCSINGAYAGSGTTPTHQPSSLSIALSNLTVNGSFSAASSGVNGYIVLRNVAPTAPANNNPASGTAYTVGQGVGPWTVAAIITDATTGTKTFSDVVPTGQCGKNVYYNIYSFQGCGSTIKYNTTSPLNGSLALSNPSTANAGSAITHCNNPNFTLAGNNPAIGVGTWSLASGTATIANPASNVSGVTLAAGQTATLTWTINSGGCHCINIQCCINQYTGFGKPYTNKCGVLRG